MEFSNKQVTYSVSHTDTNFTMEGTLHLDEMDRIVNLNGTLFKEDVHSGDFHYSETEDGKVNKSMSGVSKNLAPEACAFVQNVVDLIKTDINK